MFFICSSMTSLEKIENIGLINTYNPLIIKQICLAVPAGFPSPAQDFAEEEFNLNSLIDNPNATHVMRLSGESMQPTIMDGAMLIVDCSRTPKHNDIVVATVNNEHTCKRFFKRQGRVGLFGDNKNFAFIDFNDGDELRIFGVVTCHFHEH